MRVIIISDGERYYPAELIGDTDKAMVLSVQAFKRPKYARRLARRTFGAGNLMVGKWEVALPRGQTRFEPGHLVTVKGRSVALS